MIKVSPFGHVWRCYKGLHLSVIVVRVLVLLALTELRLRAARLIPRKDQCNEKIR